MAITDEYELGSSEVFVLRPGQEVRVDLRLRRLPESPGTLVIGAVSSRGSPLAGATVKFFDPQYNPVGHVRTGPTGRYAAFDLRPGRYLAAAAAPGHVLPAAVQFDLIRGMPVAIDFNLSPEPRDRGVVYGIAADRSGVPIVGVRVMLRERRTGRRVAETLTNGDGQYLLGGVHAGVYTLAASRRGYIDALIAAVVVSPREFTHHDIEMTPEPFLSQGTVSGVVRAKNGESLGGAFVALYRVEEGVERLVRAEQAAPDGMYLFTDVEPGRYRVKVNGMTVGECTVTGR